MQVLVCGHLLQQGLLVIQRFCTRLAVQAYDLVVRRLCGGHDLGLSGQLIVECGQLAGGLFSFAGIGPRSIQPGLIIQVADVLHIGEHGLNRGKPVFQLGGQVVHRLHDFARAVLHADGKALHQVFADFLKNARRRVDSEDVFQGRHRAVSYFGDVVLHPGDHPADAVDKALDHLPAQVQHGLGQLLHPVVQGIDNGFRGAGNKRPGPLDTVADGRHQLFADVEPVEGQEHVDDGVQDFRDVGHQSGDGLDQALGQRDDKLHPGGQNLGGVVVDDACDVGDDLRHVLNQGGDTVGKSLRKGQD